ncbi:MAG: hypothetical protein COA58_00625 [Bacteroidetes bacterium]|nr:MAG: hypothetical protein COA58_00625 [Bacteroidota bacterium]
MIQKAPAYLLILFLFILGSNEVVNAQSEISKRIDNANKNVITNPEEAFNIASEALSESKKIKDKKAEASAYNTLGTLYYNTGQYNKAIDYFTLAKDLYATVDDIKSEEYTLKYLAKSFEALSQNDKSIDYYRQAGSKSNSSSNKNDYTFRNAKIKRKQGKKVEAIQDLEDELQGNSSLNTRQKVDIYLELGDLYLGEKETKKGVELINKAIETSYEDTTIVSTDSITITTLNSAWQIYNYNGLENLNSEVQKKVLDKAIFDNSNSVSSAASFNLGQSYLESDPETAAGYFKFSAALTKDKPKGKDHVKAVERLSQAYEKSGEYGKALEKYKEYVLLVDSIKEAELTTKLYSESLKDKYQIQESKIAELELKQAQKEESLRIQQNTIIGLVLGIVAFLLLTYFLIKSIRQKQRSNMLIQLASLRSQMNPHFIFNSLNSVNGFISKNEEIKANRYISDFSKLMRTVLNNSHNPTISLAEEIKSLEIYLSLEHSRFADKFDYEITVNPNINKEDINVPPMLLQPYIENAVWHGLRYKSEKGFLKLDLNHENNFLKVTIEDNGIGRKQSQELKTNHQRDYKSTGIANTKERVRLLNKLHKAQYSVHITDLMHDGKPNGTRVEIMLPTDIDTND